MIVFSTEWFRRHQRVLLWLVNTPVIRLWFRWVLRIRSCDLACGRRILVLAPNHYVVAGETADEYQAEFRTRDKYARRLYHALYPLWAAFHAWDMLVARPLVPRLSFGFDTFGPVYPDTGNPGATTVDGAIGRIAATQTWAGIRDGAGTHFNATAGEDDIFVLRTQGTTTWGRLYRSFYHFDTSALDDAATISAGTFSVYVTSKTDVIGISPSLGLYASTVTSNTTLAASDFQSVGSTAFATAIAYSSVTTGAYNDLTLNASGLAAISKTGVTKLAIREGQYDGPNVEPTHSGTDNQSSTFVGRFADYTLTTNDPKLVLTYSLGATAALTGTVTASITEADIVAGGKTVILTLTGDTWIPA